MVFSVILSPVPDKMNFFLHGVIKNFFTVLTALVVASEHACWIPQRLGIHLDSYQKMFSVELLCVPNTASHGKREKLKETHPLFHGFFRHIGRALSLDLK